MTKAELQKSHDAMAQFLKELCVRSDEYWHGNRCSDTEKRYRKARRLLKRAGVEYVPAHLSTSELRETPAAQGLSSLTHQDGQK